MKVAAKAKQMRSEGHDVVNLSMGEPDFPTPENIKNAAKKAIDDNQTKYTINAGTVELREAIVNRIKEDYNLDYSINEIIVSCGAKHSVFNSIQAICSEGDEVIIPAPYWVSYPHMASLAQAKSVVIDTSEETGFKITAAQLKEAVTPKTKALILCNPSNPTGSAYTKQDLEAIAGVVRENDFFVIADEIYDKLVYDGFEFTSFPTLGEDIKNKTILINGVSKAYSMTGWRVGYTAAPLDVVKGINKIQSHSTSNACSIAQAASVEAFAGPQGAVSEMKAQFEERRNYIHEALNSIEGISAILPEGAFYLFPNVSGLLGKSAGSTRIENSYDLSMFLLEEGKVATVPGSSFGAEGFIRISYADGLDNLKKAVERIKEAASKLS
jgi:aspartate/methionine/tyrosine aminotransferase